MSGAKSNKLDYRLKGGLWANAWKISAGLGVLGLAGAGAAYSSGAERFSFAWLFAFLVCLTIGLGCTFFVLVQHLVGAHWSVTVRRTAEFFMAGLPILALLFLPVLASMDHLYPWTHLGGGHHGAPQHQSEHGGHGEAAAGEHAGGGERPAGEHGAPAQAGEGHHGGQHVSNATLAELSEQAEHHAHHEVMMSKTAWLNRNGFYVRVVLYFLFWIFLSQRLWGLSRSQDESKDMALTPRMMRTSLPGLVLFALSLTFSGFDWIMSLDPTWYSTIFGVWIFAGSCVASLATITLVTASLRSGGHTGEAITVEHHHDLGKLLFGFNVFWAYISFSQFFLIWYAGIPEETSFYHRRWSDGPWVNVGLCLLFMHFVVPFLFLLSRNIKRRLGLLQLGAVLLLCMHVIEVYWWILPNYHHSARPGGVFEPSWVDATCLLGAAGCYLAAVFYRLANSPLIPVGDPRLKRSLHHEN